MLQNASKNKSQESHVLRAACVCVCVRRKWWIDFNETWKGGKRAKENPFNFGEDLG